MLSKKSFGNTDGKCTCPAIGVLEKQWYIRNERQGVAGTAQTMTVTPKYAKRLA